MPPVRLAPRAELAAAARVAPLLRAARDLRAWATQQPDIDLSRVLGAEDAQVAADALELTPDELGAAWQVVAAAAEAPTAAETVTAAEAATAAETSAAH